MEISRRTDYAIRLVAALMQNNGKPMSVREAAEMQDVPYSFARGIQHDLVKSGVVASIRGARGGMVLAIDPEEYTLAELVETMQGPITISACLSEKGWCPRDTSCVFHKVWGGASTMLREYLSSVTMKDILSGVQPVIQNLGEAPAVRPELSEVPAQDPGPQRVATLEFGLQGAPVLDLGLQGAPPVRPEACGAS